MENFDLPRQALEALPRGVAVFDRSLRLYYTNPLWQKCFASSESLCSALGCKRRTVGAPCEEVCSDCDLFRLIEKGSPDVNGECRVPEARGGVIFSVSQIDASLFVILSREIDRAERIRISDLERAKLIQQRFLPEQGVTIGGCRFRYTYRQQYGVGGDLFGGYEIDDHTTGLFIADVSGAGVSGSLLTCILRLGIDRKERSPAAAIRAFRELVQTVELPDEAYITLFVMALDFEKHQLSYCNAAHNQPVLLRRGSDVIEISTPGSPIGSWHTQSTPYCDRFMPFAKGDLLALYTDGVTDNCNEKGENYEDGRVQALLQEGHSADETIAAFERSVKKFKGERDNNDDLTMVLVEITK